jgi:hypothetical protein
MCTDQSDYSTICGPRSLVVTLRDVWPRLAATARFGLSAYPPELIDLGTLTDEELAQKFRAPDSPAVAVVKHTSGVGLPFTTQLQVELMVGSHERGMSAMPGLVCEPGYQFYGAQPGRGGQFQFAAGKLAQLTGSVPAIYNKAAGFKVALLDSGLDPASVPTNSQGNQMVDFVDSLLYGVRGPGPTADPHGHGTAMAQIIDALQPQADIHPIRVLNDSNTAESHEVLAGLQYALFLGQFDCVLASLSSPAATICATSLGRSVEWMVEYCRNQAKVLPPIIAAAGNSNSNPSGYPAKVPDAVVALAVDGYGNDVNYNSTPPPNATILRAYGGDNTDALGDIVHIDGTTTRFYGTSMAAAAIAGAYLP